MSTSGRTERVGFLGLGIMGSRMAANLARAGFELNVWTHTSGKAAAWAGGHGASAFDTPAQVAQHSDIVVSMVVDGAQVRQLMLGDAGVIGAARPGLLCVDMSTISPGDTVSIAERLAEHSVHMIDAPVTGSAPRAQEGSLTIMAGGPREDFERALPLLQVMGTVVEHVGELGKGEMLKLINNSLAAANACAVAEALVLARAGGVDLDALVRIASAGSGGSTMLTLKAGAMAAHDYTTLFKTEHMLKDVRLCLEEAQAAGVPFPAASHARDLLSATMARGYGDQDFAAIIEAAEGLAGRTL